MKMQNSSLLWTIALYLTVSAICVTASTLYRKNRNVEAAITSENDATIGNELLSTDSEDHNSVDEENIDKEKICLMDALNAAYLQCRKANKNIASFLPSSPALARSNLIGVVHGTTGNYMLSFEIVPRGTVSEWGSILHFTTGENMHPFGSRAPAFWFFPGETRLHLVISDAIGSYWNWGIDLHHGLPFNVHTKVTLECNGASVRLTVGGHVYTARQPSHRFAGKLLVYAGDPWSQNANAEIYGFQYEILPATKAKADLALQSDTFSFQEGGVNILDSENKDN